MFPDPISQAPRGSSAQLSGELQSELSAELRSIRTRIDGTLNTFLADLRGEMADVAPEALLPIDEVIRLIAAGGKRLRPAFCYWGFRAGGGSDGEPIERAAASLELLHTMALIHDDLMDRSSERRGVAASARHLADEARRGGSSDPDHTGRSLALLAGDLAVVLADRLMLTSGFDADVLVPALDRYHRMRTDMALGQSLDVAADADPIVVAALKGGSYTVEGPLQIGALLAQGGPEVLAALADYGAPVGLAFQLRDDERDGDIPVVPGRVTQLIVQGRAALDAPGLESAAVASLRALADLVAG
ncbi:MAG: polyprenyl synthetase family protein [Actinomycetota bacterium]